MGSIQDAINTFKNAVYGKDVRAALVDVAEAVAGQVINLDTGLTQSGYAADAKAVGDRLATVNSSIATNRDNIQANSGQIGTINQTLTQHNSAIATNRDNIQANSGQISTINQTIASMDTSFSGEIDEVLDLIVPEYSSDETYEIGEFCRKDNVLYQCTTRAVEEAWNALHWNATTVGEALNISGLVTAYYDRQGTYQVGDYVIYDGGMYRCKKAHSASGSWVAANWDPVTVTEEIGNMFGTLADDYSVTNTYEIGDYVVYGGKLYRCKVRAVTENWTAAHWDEVQIQSMLRALRAEIDARLSADEATITSLMENTVASVFSATKAYSAGDYAIYNGKLYRFTVDHAAGAWVGTDATVIVLGDDVSYLKSAFNDMVSSRYGVYESPNIIENDESMTLGYVSKNGNISASSSMAYTDYLPVKEGFVLRAYYTKQGVFVQKGIRMICAYDENKNPLSAYGSNTSLGTYTVPDGVHFVRITFDGIITSGSTATSLYTVSVNCDPAEYTAYTEPYVTITDDFLSPESQAAVDKIKDNALSTLELANKYGVALPRTKIFQTIGLPEKWYKKSMVTPPTDFVWASAGIAYLSHSNDGVTFDNTDALSSSNGYSWYRWDDFLNLIASYTGNAGYGGARRIIEENLSDCSLLAIGDSTVDHDTMTATLLSHFAEQGRTITLLGTLGDGSSTNKNEGRAGWRAADYFTDRQYQGVTNPFYNPTTQTFDFNYYMTNQGYSAPDFVLIQLGINDLYNYDDSAIEPTWNYIKGMIDSILAYDQSIKIILNLPTTPNSDQAELAVPEFNYRNRVIRYNEYAQAQALSVYGTTKVRCSYCHLILDPDTEIRDNVHPTPAGYAKMALEVVNQINCWQAGV